VGDSPSEKTGEEWPATTEGPLTSGPIADGNVEPKERRKKRKKNRIPLGPQFLTADQALERMNSLAEVRRKNYEEERRLPSSDDLMAKGCVAVIVVAVAWAVVAFLMSGPSSGYKPEEPNEDLQELLTDAPQGPRIRGQRD
jgi:hypothetical protein